MEKWIWMITSVTVIMMFAVVVLIYRTRMRRLTESLNSMLQSAIDGNFNEHTFDESMLSAVESKMFRFLSSYAISSKKLTDEKNKIKELISDISHQTKTPVANILLYSQLLGEHELTEDCRLCVNALSLQAEKLEFLIGALVKMSRLESGIIEVRPLQCAVKTLLEDAVKQITPKAEEKKINIRMKEFDCMAYYDSKWTVEAVYNVLDNAIKYSPCGSSITINAITYEMFLRIDISDEGPGIPEEEQSKIFSRFYRSPSVSTEEGIGLGLFLTREILSNAGGYIRVTSKPGQGSTFSVFLPT